MHAQDHISNTVTVCVYGLLKMSNDDGHVASLHNYAPLCPISQKALAIKNTEILAHRQLGSISQ